MPTGDTLRSPRCTAPLSWLLQSARRSGTIKFNLKQAIVCSPKEEPSVYGYDSGSCHAVPVAATGSRTGPRDNRVPVYCECLAWQPSFAAPARRLQDGTTAVAGWFADPKGGGMGAGRH